MEAKQQKQDQKSKLKKQSALSLNINMNHMGNSTYICENLLSQIIEQTYAQLQHHKIFQQMLYKQNTQKSVDFLNNNYQKILSSYYVHHQQHSPKIKQEKCLKNNKKKYFISEILEKQKQGKKNDMPNANSYHKPYIIKKALRLNTMNETSRPYIFRSINQRLSHNVTLNHIQNNDSSKLVLRYSVKPSLVDKKQEQGKVKNPKLKKMNSTFFTAATNTKHRKQSQKSKQGVQVFNLTKYKTELSQNLVCLQSSHKQGSNTNEIDKQINILRQRKIKLDNIVNLFDVQISKTKNSDKVKANKDLINKKLNYTTNFDGSLLPICLKKEYLQEVKNNENVLYKIKNLELQSNHDRQADSKKKKTIVSVNQSQNKNKRKINKKFSSLIESIKKIKITENQISKPQSKQISSIEQLKFVKFSKENTKKIRFQDQKKNESKQDTKRNSSKNSSQISKQSTNSLMEHTSDNIKKQSSQMNATHYIMSPNNSRWQRKQKLMKKMNFSYLDIKTSVNNIIDQKQEDSM